MCDCVKITLNRGSLDTNCRKWPKNKKTTTTDPKKNEECLKYALTAALHHQEIPNHLERISNLKPLGDQYISKKVNFSDGEKDWEKFVKNNHAVALNIPFIDDNDIEYAELEIKQVYISKHNSKREITSNTIDCIWKNMTLLSSGKIICIV